MNLKTLGVFAAVLTALPFALGLFLVTSDGNNGPENRAREQTARTWLRNHRQLNSTVECEGAACTVVPATGNPYLLVCEAAFPEGWRCRLPEPL